MSDEIAIGDAQMETVDAPENETPGHHTLQIDDGFIDIGEFLRAAITTE